MDDLAHPLAIAAATLRRRPSTNRRDTGARLPLPRTGERFLFPLCHKGNRVQHMADTEVDLLRSSLDLLMLKALSWGPMHGYAINEWIEGATQSLLLLEEGTLYPALHRLERRGWIASEWGLSETNRRAKFYRLTPAGRMRFRTQAPLWHRHADAIAVALKRTSAEVL